MHSTRMGSDSRAPTLYSVCRRVPMRWKLPGGGQMAIRTETATPQPIPQNNTHASPSKLKIN